jgi:hypothetical protein
LGGGVVGGRGGAGRRWEGGVTSFTDKRANAFSFALISYHVSSSSSVPDVERFFCLLRLLVFRLELPLSGFERFFFFRG